MSPWNALLSYLPIDSINARVLGEKAMLEIYLVISETNGPDQLCDWFHSYSYVKANATKYWPIPSLMSSYDYVCILTDALVFHFTFHTFIFFPSYFFHTVLKNGPCWKQSRFQVIPLDLLHFSITFLSLAVLSQLYLSHFRQCVCPLHLSGHHSSFQRFYRGMIKETVIEGLGAVHCYFGLDKYPLVMKTSKNLHYGLRKEQRES